MGFRRVLLLGCVILAAHVVAGVSIKGFPDDVRNPAPNKGSLEDAKNALDANSTAVNITSKHGAGSLQTPTVAAVNITSKYGAGSLQTAAVAHRDLRLPRIGNNLVDPETDDGVDEDRDEAKASIELPNSKRLQDRRVESSLEDRPVESSVYKKDTQSVIISNLTSSNKDPKHGALMNREIDTVDPNRSEVSSEEDQDTNLPINVGKERKYHRKKRLHPSSSAPSAQLIILVVGAVLACVIITGFIRWRVRRRLNAKKLKQMSDNFSAFRGKKEFPKKTSMDTIYECDCEHGMNVSLTRDLGILTYTEIPQDNGPSRLDEDSSAHRFEVHPSVTGSSCCDVCSYGQLLPLKSSRTEKDPSRGYHKHHGHRRHHKRRSHDKKYAHKFETIGTDSNIRNIEITKSPILGSSLMEQCDETEAQYSDNGRETLTPTSPPPLVRQPSPHPHRRVLGSLVDTWRSLSFNRDWVGKMWQEKHGVRRISDVLRGLNTTSDPDTDMSMQEDISFEDDMAKYFTISALAAGTAMSMATLVEGGCEDSVCAAITDTCDDVTAVSLCNEGAESEELLERNLTNENLLPVPAVESDWSSPIRDYHVDTDTSARLVEAEPSHMLRTGALGSSLSFGDHLEEPPGYDSLLDSGRHSMNLSSRNGIEHPRHHRRHRRKHRDRSGRHVYSRVHDDDQSHTDHADHTLSYDHDELEPLTNIQRPHDLPSASSLDPNVHDADSIATSNSQTTMGQGQNTVHNLYPNLGSNLGSSAKGAPFGQQEGIVIEQLSDGAQIIYLPPPVLPSYHNDTPPPYHK